MRARIKSYELAFRMQMEVPKVFSTTDAEVAGAALHSGSDAGRFSYGWLCPDWLVRSALRMITLHGWLATKGSQGIVFQVPSDANAIC